MDSVRSIRKCGAVILGSHRPNDERLHLQDTAEESRTLPQKCGAEPEESLRRAVPQNSADGQRVLRTAADVRAGTRLPPRPALLLGYLRRVPGLLLGFPSPSLVGYSFAGHQGPSVRDRQLRFPDSRTRVAAPSVPPSGLAPRGWGGTRLPPTPTTTPRALIGTLFEMRSYHCNHETVHLRTQTGPMT
ncbi:hypothetical protein CDAR_559221 [Caerostris darwini]|uniref:Uncharacterized protein n=1 Tax=Caerostris darwini TaxID=1538125 RepID=A0AAV4P2C2_9ARAC|nr:hypothetical protein CDAR_559221 [Caerostris darwini]